MSYTGSAYTETGKTVYGKPWNPLDLTWATGIVTMAEQGTTGVYTSDQFVDGQEYLAYDQAGGSEAATDTIIGTIQQIAETSGDGGGSEPRPIYNDQPRDPQHLQIVQGAAYDGVANDPFTWDAGKSIDGKKVVFSIRWKSDSDNTDPVFQKESTGAGQIATVALTTAETNSIPLSCQSGDQKFNVLVEMATDSWLNLAGPVAAVTTYDSTVRPPQ